MEMYACGSCGKKGHNVRTCVKRETLPPPKVSNTPPSQPYNGESVAQKGSYINAMYGKIIHMTHTATLAKRDKDEKRELYTLEDLNTLWELLSGKTGYEETVIARTKTGVGTVYKNDWGVEETKALHSLITQVQPSPRTGEDSRTQASGISKETWRMFLDKFSPKVKGELLSYFHEKGDAIPDEMFHGLIQYKQEKVPIRQGLFVVDLTYLVKCFDPPEDFIINDLVPRLDRESKSNGDAYKYLTAKPYLSGATLTRLETVLENVIDENSRHGVGGHFDHDDLAPLGYYRAFENILKHPNLPDELVTKYTTTPQKQRRYSASFKCGDWTAALIYTNPKLTVEYVDNKFVEVFNEIQTIRKKGGNSFSMEENHNRRILNCLMLNPNLPQVRKEEFELWKE